MAGIDVDFAMVPFRGEHYDVQPERADLVDTLVYPIPDPELPFLGVDLTPTVDGGLNVGPNAVPGALARGLPELLLRPARRPRHRHLPGHVAGGARQRPHRRPGDAQLAVRPGATCGCARSTAPSCGSTT